MKLLRLVFGALILLLWLVPGGVAALAGFRDFALSAWCRIGLWAMGVHVAVRGQLPPKGVLIAANHASYIDIFVLGAFAPGSFLAKSEVRSWPVVGFASRLAGVLFIEREKAKSASAMLSKVAERLDKGARVLLFPEAGIIGAAGEITPFRPMFFDEAAIGGHPIVPAAIRFLHPADPRVWAWTDNSSPVGHMFRNLLPADYVRCALLFGEPTARSEGEGRKETAARIHHEVRRLWSSMEE